MSSTADGYPKGPAYAVPPVGWDEGPVLTAAAKRRPCSVTTDRDLAIGHTAVGTRRHRPYIPRR